MDTMPDTGADSAHLRSRIDALEAEKLSMQSYINALSMQIFLLRKVLDYIPDYIFAKNTESKFLYNNLAHLKCLGFGSQQEVLGKSDFDFFPRELASQYYADEQYVVKTGNPVEGREELTKTSDGTPQVLSTTKDILKNENNEILGIIGISRDVTQKIKSDEEKEQLQTQLQQAQKLESLGQLAGGIAHDFNNMLGAISGYAGMLERKLRSMDPTMADYAHTIIEAAERAADLTQKLLDFARKGKYALKVIDMNDMAREVIKLLEHTIDRRIEMIAQLSAKPATIMGDPAQIQNSIINLAINARDAMPKGGSMTFRTAMESIAKECPPPRLRSLSPGKYVVFSLADTGIGMDSATIARIFEPFFTTKEKGHGTGLGLASVYGIVKNHNGQIVVDSTPGAGSVFSLYFPLVDKPAESQIIRSDNISSGEGAVLIIDDEDMIRRMASDMLREMGYQVHCCANGVEAIEFYKENCSLIDVIILDMIMPKMSGADCAHEIKKINPDARIILATGYSSPHDTQRIIARGISGFIQKPFDETELSSVIRDVLKK